MFYIYEDTFPFLSEDGSGRNNETMSAFNTSNNLLSASSKKSSTAFAILELTELVIAK